MPDEDKKPKCEKGAPKWMVTFGDMMTLLLTFFVLLLSFSVMDQQRFIRMAGTMKDAFGIQKQQVDIETNPLGVDIISKEFQTVPLDVQVKISDSIAEEFNAGLVEVEHGPEGMTLRVKDAIAFESGKAVILPRFKSFLDKLGKAVAELDVHIIVSGHTDNVPMKKEAAFRSNWELSAARAVAVVEYWIEKYKIPHERLAAKAAADGQPIADNNTEEGRARNRRVEFLVKPGRQTPAFDGIKFLENLGESGTSGS